MKIQAFFKHLPGIALGADYLAGDKAPQILAPMELKEREEATRTKV